MNSHIDIQPQLEIPIKIVNTGAIIAPISNEQPTGVNCRDNLDNNSDYQKLRLLRANARDNERKAQANGDNNFTVDKDWAEILKIAENILTYQSKDIEVLAWFIEAMVRIHGFAGFASGFAIAVELIKKFSGSLYPIIDEDGVDAQLAPLAGLNGYGADGALIAPLKSIPITGDESGRSFCAWQCEQVFEIERITDTDKRNNREKQYGISMAVLNDATEATPVSFFLQTHSSIQASLKVYKQFQLTIDDYAKNSLQPTANIEKTLQGCSKTFEYIAGSIIAAKQLEEQQQSDDQVAVRINGSKSSNGNMSNFNDGINSRAQALAALQDIATFFRRTEPHSPISYSVEQVIRWASLPLTDLIEELIPDDTARTKFQKLSGIYSLKQENQD